MSLPDSLIDELRACLLLEQEFPDKSAALEKIRNWPIAVPIPDELAQQDPERLEVRLFTARHGPEPTAEHRGEWFVGNDGHPFRVTMLEYPPQPRLDLPATTETALTVVPKAEPPAPRSVVPAPTSAAERGLGEFYDHLPRQKRRGWRWRRWLG